MNEWEIKYKALCAGIYDKSMIDNAERFAKVAIDLSIHTGKSLDECAWLMMDALKPEIAKRTKNNLNELLKKSKKWWQFWK